MFGEPNQGVHALRFLNIAVVDVFSTLLGAYLLHYFTGWPLVWTLVGLFVLGIILHRVFCVRTTVDRFLFG